MATATATRTTRERPRDPDRTERKLLRRPAKEAVEDEPAVASADGMAKIDSTRLVNLATKMKKLMGAPETLKVSIGKTVSVSAEYASGSLILHDRGAVQEYPTKTIRFMIPFVVLNSAMAKRGQVSIGMRENMLIIKGNRYKAELNIERPAKEAEFQPMAGVDSDPLKRCLSEAHNYLTLTNMIEETPIDIHFKWGKGKCIGAAADAYHAVLVYANMETEGEHQVTMPIELAQKLGEIGGQFDIGDSRVQAESELGRAEINQIGSSDTVIPLESIRGLLKQPIDWKCEINSEALLALLDNLYAVVEWNQRIEFNVSDRQIKIDSRGRHGKVTGSVDIASLAGDPPEKLTVNNAILYSIISKLSNNIYISVVGGMLRIEPVEQGEWKFIGFVNLSANEDGE